MRTKIVIPPLLVGFAVAAQARGPSFQFPDRPLQPQEIALIVAFLVISLGVHEAAHGWTALKCGDTTARDLGRITLNPFAHIDLFMTIILPAICMATAGFPFGGAKPVPVNFYNLRKPFRDMALVALAGPASNVLLAGLFYLAWKVVAQDMEIWGPSQSGYIVLGYTIYLNLLLAVFNMLPIPPLDGSRIMTWLLPPGLREPYQRLEPFGLLIVILCLFMIPQVQFMMLRTISALWVSIEYVVSAGGAW